MHQSHKNKTVSYMLSDVCMWQTTTQHQVWVWVGNELSRSSSEFKTLKWQKTKSDIMTTDFQSVWMIHCHVPSDRRAEQNIRVFSVNYWIALFGAHWRPFWQTSHFMHSHWLAWRPFLKDNGFLMSIKDLTSNPLMVVLTRLHWRKNPNIVFTVSYSILPSLYAEICHTVSCSRWILSLITAGPCFTVPPSLNCLTRIHCFEMHWITAVDCPGEVRLTFTGHDYQWQGGLGLCVWYSPFGDGWTGLYSCKEGGGACNAAGFGNFTTA